MQHPYVLEVAVIGVPDKYRGETPRAYIQLKAGKTLSTTQLDLFLKQKLSSIEMPSGIEFQKELPKTVVGKIDKIQLKKKVSAVYNQLV